MSYLNPFKKEISEAAKSHWTCFNKMRMDFADGTMPDNNPVSFYFFASPTPVGDGEMNLKVRFQRASIVALSEADFFDGLVTGDNEGNPVITWTDDIRCEEELAALAKDLINIPEQSGEVISYHTGRTVAA